MNFKIEKKLEDIPEKSIQHSPTEIKIGARVKLEDGSEIGEVLSIKNNQALVAFGNFQTKVKLHQLISVQKTTTLQPTTNKKYSSKILIEKSEFDFNLDIRGLMKDEAITTLDNFMDKVLMYGIKNIKIIHGRGTGALKQTVQQYLKKFPHVHTFKFESDQFGGDGITLVEMK